MCVICEKVKTIECFPTPEAYFECLNYIQSLVDSGSFLFVSKDCDTDKVKNKDGHWIADVISHVIRCKNCGQCFICTAITYRGGGGFQKEEMRFMQKKHLKAKMSVREIRLRVKANRQRRLSGTKNSHEK